MSKYIKLDDAKAILWGLSMPLCDYESAMKDIESLQTTEIVRCKDCKHYNFETHGCKRNPSVERWWEDDFCSYGEKQVTGKLSNADDSLLTEDTEMGKEQKSKLESVDTPTNTPINTPTDLISRQAAIEALTGWQTDPTDDEIEHTPKALPPEEPQRPRGEWIEYIDDRNGRRYVKCSSCNKTTLNAVDYDVLDGERHSVDFCPKCGADMRGMVTESEE